MLKTTLSITIDIEDWYHIPSVCGSPFSVYRGVDEFFREWDGHYDRLTRSTERTLALLRDYGVRATCFVVADVVEHYPGLVESIVDEGHEIACHGLHHACKIDFRSKKPLMAAEEFEARTRQAKRMLERVSGQPVIGYRAPNALIGGWMLDSLERLGFRYDSSVCVNSFYNKTDSPLRGVSSSPYRPGRSGLEPAAQRRFIEFPWAYYDVGVKVPTAGGPALRFFGRRLICRGLMQSLQRGHTIVYFHPLDLSDEKFPNVGNGRPCYWLIKGSAVEEKLRWILGYFRAKGVTLSSIGDIVESWL